MTRSLPLLALASVLFTSPALAYDDGDYDDDEGDVVMQVEAEAVTGILGIGEMMPEYESSTALGYGVMLGLVDPERFFGTAVRFDAEFALGVGEASLFRVGIDLTFQKHFEVIDNRDFIEIGIGPSLTYDSLTLECGTMCTPEQQALADVLAPNDSVALGAHLDFGYTHVLTETIFLGANLRGRLLHALRQDAAPARYETLVALRFGTFIEL
jgi:hypothetical protein